MYQSNITLARVHVRECRRAMCHRARETELAPLGLMSSRDTLNTVRHRNRLANDIAPDDRSGRVNALLVEINQSAADNNRHAVRVIAEKILRLDSQNVSAATLLTVSQQFLGDGQAVHSRRESMPERVVDHPVAQSYVGKNSVLYS